MSARIALAVSLALALALPEAGLAESAARTRGAKTWTWDGGVPPQRVSSEAAPAPSCAKP